MSEIRTAETIAEAEGFAVCEHGAREDEDCEYCEVVALERLGVCPPGSACNQGCGYCGRCS